MVNRLRSAAMAISVPIGLENRILVTCRTEAAHRNPLRFIPALAACAAVVVAVVAINPLINHYIQETTPDAAPSVGAPSNPSGDASLIVTPPTADPSDAPTTAKPSTVPTTALPSGTTADGSTKLIYYGIFEEMSVAELEAYFGRAVLPAWVPDDLQPTDNGERHGIYRRDDQFIAENPAGWAWLLKGNHTRDEDIVRDVNRFYYRGDNGRNLSVEIATPPCPRTYIGDPNRFKETVSVNGVSMKLAFYIDEGGSSGYAYSAMFAVDGVEYYLNGWNIPREEFLRIVKSLL